MLQTNKMDKPYWAAEHNSIEFPGPIRKSMVSLERMQRQQLSRNFLANEASQSPPSRFSIQTP